MGAYENSLASSTVHPYLITGLVGTAKTNSASLSWPAIKSSLGGSDRCCKYQIPGLSRMDSQVGTAIHFYQPVLLRNLTNGTIYTFSVAAQDTITSLNRCSICGSIGYPSYIVDPTWYVAASGGKAPGYRR